MNDDGQGRHRNTTREIFVESLISIKGEAEQALARKVDCSVVSVPDYLGDIDRDAVVAAAADVGFESVQIMRPSEAIRLAYDFGECSGRHLATGCDLNQPFITLVVDFTPRSLSLVTVSMGKDEATVLDHLETSDWRADGVNSSELDEEPELTYAYRLQEKLATMLAEIIVPNELTKKVGSQPISSIKEINAVVLIGNATPAGHILISNILVKLLENDLGAKEDWLFQIIDPSQVVSIGAARRAKALVDTAALTDSRHQQQAAREGHEEL